MKCSKCNGAGMIHDYEQDHHYGCDKCDGLGVIEETAKAMFEELGYKFMNYCKDIIYYKDFEYATVELYFDIDIGNLIIQSNKDIAFTFCVKELKAINKQVEELGWNK